MTQLPLLELAALDLWRARRFVTLAFADELIECPELLAAYGARFGDGEDAALAIDALHALARRASAA